MLEGWDNDWLHLEIDMPCNCKEIMAYCALLTSWKKKRNKENRCSNDLLISGEYYSEVQ